jgi:nitrous oxidase accessory protein NosD
MKHKGCMLGLLIVFIFLAAANACQAATVSVEPGQRIQAVIDSARSGDVIRVEKGLYNENLNISKQVTLVGIEMPLLDAKAPGSAITIQAEGVNVTGFGLRNSRRSGIAVFSRNNTIKGNNISGCNDGIRAEN